MFPLTPTRVLEWFIVALFVAQNGLCQDIGLSSTSSPVLIVTNPPASSLASEVFVPIGKTNQTSGNATAADDKKLFVNTDAANNNYTNFAQYNGKLFGGAISKNGSIAPEIGLKRLITSQASTSSSSSSSSNSNSSSSSSMSVAIILISLAVFTCIVALIIAALFVMRRRFSIWRINGDKANSSTTGCNDGANGALTNSSSDSGSTMENKCVINVTNEAAAEASEKEPLKGASAGDEQETATVLKSAASKCNVAAVEPTACESTKEATSVGEPNKADIEVVADAPSAATTEPKEQLSPSSDTPLISSNNTDEAPLVALVANAVETVEAPVTNTAAAVVVVPAANTVSSSSLIVNVLNELSDSVACKLAAKSPTKSTDPEKQPLNE